MPTIRLTDTDAVKVPYDLFGQIESELGDRDLTTAAFRMVADPAYQQKAVQAVRSGQWPTSVIQASRKIRAAMQPKPQQQPEAVAGTAPGSSVRPSPAGPAVSGFLTRALRG